MGVREPKRRRKAGLIETPCGPMTRREAAELSGLSMMTITRRVWEGWPVEELFVRLKRGDPSPHRPRYRKYVPKPKEERKKYDWLDDSHFILPYAKFKEMKQRERDRAKLRGDMPRKTA